MVSHDDTPGQAAANDGSLEMTAQFLAEIHGARQLRRQIMPLGSRHDAPNTHDLWQHANRRPGDAVSFSIERAIRSDAQVAARYRKILSSMAITHAPVAIAASDGPLSTRRVGDFTFSVALGDGTPLLIISVPEGARIPQSLEISGADLTLRLALNAPVNGAIFLSLDPAYEEGRQLAALVADAHSEIFIL